MPAVPALGGVVTCAVVAALATPSTAFAAVRAGEVVITSQPRVVTAARAPHGPPTASVVVQGRVSAVRLGRVLLERRATHGWTTIGSAALSPASTFAVRGTRLPVGTLQLRVVKASSKGSPAVAARPFALTVRAPAAGPASPPPAPTVPVASPVAPGAPVPPADPAPLAPEPVLAAPLLPAPVDPPVTPACVDPVRPSTGLFVAGFQAGTSNGYATRPFAAELQADGGQAPYHWSVTDGLPVGITLNGAMLTGLTTAKGVFHPHVVVTDAAGHHAGAAVCIQFVSPLAVPPTVLPQAVVGQTYLAPLVATGGYLPLIWQPEESAMDAGLTRYADSLTGVFTKAGVVSYEMQVLDGAYTTAGGVVTIPVGPQPTVHRTIRVPADAATISAAIAAAENGDTVLVSPGTYDDNLDFSGKAITVESADGPTTTIIDGGYRDSTVIFRHHEGPLSVLRGFTLQHGYSNGTSIATEGGGIAALDASPIIDGNIVKDNVGVSGGGGISASDASTVENNIVEGNRQGLVQGDYTGGAGGGGISVQSMGGATVVGNQVLNNTWNGYPDGMYVAGIDVVVADNVIRGNHEPAGPPPDHPVDPTNVSGLSVVGDDISVVDNVIDGNARDKAVGLGGGDRGGIAFVGNTVVNNDGIGLAMEGPTRTVQVVDSVIASGQGLPAISCTVRYDSAPPGFSHDDVYGTDGSTAADEKTLTHACAYLAGTDGNVSVAPDFSTAAPYAPAQGSPLVDAGIDVLTGALTDIAGQPRVFDGDGDGNATLDIGAYERQ